MIETGPVRTIPTIEIECVEDGWIVSYFRKLGAPDKKVFVCVKDIIAHVTRLLDHQADKMAVHCFEGTHTCPTCSELADPPEGDTP